MMAVKRPGIEMLMLLTAAMILVGNCAADRRIKPQRNGDHDDDERGGKHQLRVATSLSRITRRAGRLKK